MEHKSLGRYRGKFPEPTEHLTEGSPFFLVGMFQTEMRVPFVISHT